jgi:hypothetical protein
MNSEFATPWLKVRPLDENQNPVLLGAEVRIFEAGTRNQVRLPQDCTLHAQTQTGASKRGR